MSALKTKSSIALITGIIILLLLIPIWYIMLAPSIMASEIEKIDSTTSFEGTLGKEEYTEFLDDIMASEIEKIDSTTSFEGTVKGGLCQILYGVEKDEEIQITITAHLYVEAVDGDNVIVKLDTKMMNRTVTGEALSDFDQNLTYVFNKFTRENDPDATDADKPREGYDPLYPSHLKEGENFTTWFDPLNTTATLEFKGIVKEEGITLYRYSGSKTITNVVFQDIFTDCTVSFVRTVLVEPLSGLPVYYENETLCVMRERAGQPSRLLLYLTYESTAEAKAQGIVDAKTAYDDIQLLELLHSVSPIRIEAHAKAEGVEGDNVIVKVDAEMTRTDTGETLPDFAQISIYVFNKFTRENDPDATDADKPREGYDPLYPSHLKKGGNITTWFDMLNTTATLEFVESVVENGVTLYRYSGSKTITKPTYMGFTDCTLSLTRTVLVEPLSGLPAYTENETFRFNTTRAGYPSLPLVYLTYESTDEAKTQGIADAKAAYEGVQLLELYLPTILGVVVIILVIGLAFNIRRLKRKMAPSAPKPAKPSSK